MDFQGKKEEFAYDAYQSKSDNACASVPQTLVWDSIKGKGIQLSYIKAIQDMYYRVTTSIQSPIEVAEPFPIEVGLH